MSLFIWDTAGNKDLLNGSESENNNSRPVLSGRGLVEPQPLDEDDIGSEEEDDGDYFGLPPPSHDISHILKSANEKETQPKSKVEEEMELASQMVEDAEESREQQNLKNVRYTHRPNKDLVFPDFDINTGRFGDDLCDTDVIKEMKTSQLDGLEKKKDLQLLRDKKLRDIRRIERAKTKGEGWFNMPATEVTEEVENDLKILQMRSALDPKHFYKKNDLKVLPKYFQVGTVQHSALDHYKERDARKNKKKTVVDELLVDDEFQRYTKRKFNEVTARNDRYAHKKAMKKMKKLKKNK